MNRRLVTDARGAMAVEFMPSFTVLMLALFCFLQMSQLYTASLVMHHATVTAARYASVSYPSRFIPDPEDRLSDGGAKSPPLREVAREGLGPWQTRVRVRTAQAEHGGRDPWGDIETTVQYEYTCRVPIGKWIVCRNGTATRTVRVVSALQGAEYVLGR